jgi:uncharacterized protein with FMN-binding domain
MKKLALSASVIIVFFLYSLFVHQQNQTDAIVSPTPSSPTTTQPKGKYKDGSYTGDPADAFYGTIQVRTTISNGTLTDVTFLQYPNDRHTSIEINTQAMPMLRSEAISAQSGNVDIITGASDSSRAFIQSLTSALAKAQ